MEKLTRFLELLMSNKRLLGTVLGFVFGILYLIFGFAKTLVFVFFVAAGYVVGKFLDDQEDWRDVIDRIMPPKYRD